MAFRRKTASGAEVAAWAELVRSGEALIIGPVRQEVLSGIREPAQFERIRDGLRAFADLPLTQHHFERAAELHNTCRSRGVQGSATDFLICAAADLYDLEVFTTDTDFDHFAKRIPVRRYAPNSPWRNPSPTDFAHMGGAENALSGAIRRVSPRAANVR